jgi:deazaflavin-dependent oxidoreductase (nitroreductase family)
MSSTEAQHLFGQEHVRRSRETDGEVGHVWKEGSTILLLTTTGRRTGRETTTPLIYNLDGETPVIVASQGGAPDHPGWFKNLSKTPEVGVQIKGDRFRARARCGRRGARTAVGADERDLAALRGVRDEDGASDPVVVLERI